MKPQRPVSGYDIIGDIHGCASLLRTLLDGLGYVVGESGAYEHADRQAVFVGDLVDRGGEQEDTLRIVKAMVEHGSAQIVMGNHEFNAVTYGIEHPDRRGEYLRARNEKHWTQHRAFLEQIDDATRAEYLAWFATLPLWLDLGGLRVVHACWHQPSMRVVEEALGGNRFTASTQFVRASTKGDPLYDAIEVLLKGPEIDLGRHGLQPYHDKDGNPRSSARVMWWRDDATTLRELAVIGGNFTTVTGETYPALPEVDVDAADRAYSYTDAVPVFYGHYWRSGEPEVGVDYTARTACVDFSAVKTGTLVAYRWDGETTIDPEHYASVTA